MNEFVRSCHAKGCLFWGSTAHDVKNFVVRLSKKRFINFYSALTKKKRNGFSDLKPDMVILILTVKIPSTQYPRAKLTLFFWVAYFRFHVDKTWMIIF